jgi:3-hydroxybutyryl-CoA dehydrogenase
MAWGDEIGWANILQQLDDLYHYYHEDRYRASPWIRNKVAQQ